MKVVPVDEAGSQLESLVDAALAGEDVIFTKSGKPTARLSALSGRERGFGMLKGLGIVRDDFDTPLPDTYFDSSTIPPVT
jgi:prevent-host-death family protein